MPLAAQLPQRFLERLVLEAIPWSRRQLQTHLEKRLQVIRQLVGRHYGSNGAKQRVPLNYVRMQTTILSRHLVARTPRVLVEARDAKLRAIAKATQQWAWELFDEMNLEKTLLRWNIEAILYPVGMLKVATGAFTAPDGYPDMTRPRVDNVDAERAVWDMKATRWDQLQYIGHRVMISKQLMVGEGWDEDRAIKLVPEPHSQSNEMGTDKTETISQDSPYGGMDLYDDIDCWEIYFPRENLLAIFPVIGGTIDARPINVRPHVGPKTDINCGPFHVLGYDEVPGNLLPSPPVHAIFDLHEAINIICRKLLNQAKNQKTNLLVQQQSSSEAEGLTKTPDMGVFAVTHPEAFNQVSFNGPNAQNMGAMQQFKNDINEHGGNFAVLGGLGVQAPTLGQEELLSQSSSKLVQFMQQEALSRTRELMRAVCWYDWHSRRDLQYNMPVEGMPGAQIPWSITPEERYGGGDSNFGRLQFNVHPYSMRPVTPEVRIAQWTKLFGEILMPAAPLMAQMGQILDVGAFAKYIAEMMDLPNFDEIVKMVPMDPAAQQGQEGGGGMQGAPRVRPPGTGQYTRRNVGTESGKDQEVMEMMRSSGDAA
jgi:hypothetical protein